MNVQNFNEMFTNNVVSFEQPGPEVVTDYWHIHFLISPGLVVIKLFSCSAEHEISFAEPDKYEKAN